MSAASLLDAASDGIDFDGLVIENGTYGYRFETPAVTERGIDAGELAALADGDPYVENWRYWASVVGGAGTARRAFLRWVEGAPDAAGHGTGAGEDGNEGDAADATSAADEGQEAASDSADADSAVSEPATRLADLRDGGRTRAWGQLRIHVRLDGDAERVYDVRHGDDADPHALTTYRDPLEARELVKYDDDGRYRPLSTAPTLPTGWRFVDLDADALLDVVDFVYPATVENWHRERIGELDVTHWRETAERQTGIYADVGDLPEEALAWAVEACCDDDACLKRREWDADAETPVDVPRGSGPFPCREPCSLFVAAAREFARIEDEPERTYELTLTPSEREQLGDLVNAVADDRADEVRAADLGDGANRYRARYLRAKRGDALD